MKQRVSFRLSDATIRALTWLSEHLGLTRTGVLELLIRDRARREKR